MLSKIVLPEPASGAVRQGRSGNSERSWLVIMPDAKLRFTLNEVKRAGKALRDGCTTWDQLIASQEAFENWQACHSYPLNEFYDSLSQCARQLSALTNVVQRRKRLDAIIAKLKKYPTMQLTTMQDIAGCRAIVKDITEIPGLVSACKEQWEGHEVFDDTDDYIAQPQKETGYRGVHLVYRFKSEEKSFNGRFVEVQFRTRWQHAWATAVETIDLFQKQTLKAGTGDPDWQRFFTLMGSAIAGLENCPTVPETPTGKELQKELQHYRELLQVEQRMLAYGSVARAVNFSLAGMDYAGLDQSDFGKSDYFVMELEANLRTTQIRGYRKDEVQKAYSDVAKAERSNANVVLVAAADFEKLKDAYPNWIIDTHNFVMVLHIALADLS